MRRVSEMMRKRRCRKIQFVERILYFFFPIPGSETLILMTMASWMTKHSWMPPAPLFIWTFTCSSIDFGMQYFNKTKKGGIPAAPPKSLNALVVWCYTPVWVICSWWWRWRKRHTVVILLIHIFKVFNYFTAEKLTANMNVVFSPQEIMQNQV